GSGSTTWGVGPGLGGATAGSAGCGASRGQAASRSSNMRPRIERGTATLDILERSPRVNDFVDPTKRPAAIGSRPIVAYQLKPMVSLKVRVGPVMPRPVR